MSMFQHGWMQNKLLLVHMGSSHTVEGILFQLQKTRKTLDSHKFDWLHSLGGLCISPQCMTLEDFLAILVDSSK